MKFFAFAPIALLALLTCNNNTIYSTSPVTAVKSGAQICILNSLSSPIGHVAIEQKRAALVDLNVTCDSSMLIQGHKLKCYDLDNIYGYDSLADTVLVYWWQCQDGQPGGLTTINVPVK